MFLECIFKTWFKIENCLVLIRYKFFGSKGPRQWNSRQVRSKIRLRKVNCSTESHPVTVAMSYSIRVVNRTLSIWSVFLVNCGPQLSGTIRNASEYNLCWAFLHHALPTVSFKFWAVNHVPISAFFTIRRSSIHQSINARLLYVFASSCYPRA